MTDRHRERQAKALQNEEPVNALGDALEENEVDYGGDSAEEMDVDADELETIHPPTPTAVAGGSSETAGTKHEGTANTLEERAPPPPPYPPSDSSSAAFGPQRVVPPPPPRAAPIGCLEPVKPAPKEKFRTVKQVFEQIDLTHFSHTMPVKDLKGNIEAHAVLKTSTLIAKWALVAELRRAKIFIPEGVPDTGGFLSAEQADEIFHVWKQNFTALPMQQTKLKELTNMNDQRNTVRKPSGPIKF